MKEPMIKESRLHEQLQASLEKGALSRIDFGIRTRGSDSKDFLCRQRRFLAFQLAPSLKRKRARSICLCHGNNLTIIKHFELARAKCFV